jgi:hypothetical protein
MTMQKETTNYIRKGATIMIAPENTPVVSAAWEPIGYAADKVKVKFDKEFYGIETEESQFPIDGDVEIKDITISGSTGQIGNEQLCAAMGRQDTQTLVIGGDSPTAVRTFAVKVVGITQRSGNQCFFHMPRAYSASAVELAFGKKDYSTLDFEFKPFHSTTGCTFDFASGTTATTLATDTFTRTAGVTYYRLAGQSATADNLISIGGTWSDGEEVMVQASSISQPITLTHTATGTGVLNLTGAVNWTMTTLDDYSILRYSASGTKFIEVGRYDSKV